MGSNIKNNAPSAFLAAIAKVIAGVTQVFPPKTSINVGGAVLTPAQIVAKLQAIVAEHQAVLDARLALQNKLEAVRANQVTDHEFVMQLHAAIVGLLGRKNPQLQQFGYTPMKPRTTTATKNVAAAAKREKTRQMRNTMGKKQKLAVRALTAPDVVISNGEATIASSAAPAPEASTAAPNGATAGTDGSGGAAFPQNSAGGASGSNGGGK